MWGDAKQCHAPLEPVRQATHSGLDLTDYLAAASRAYWRAADRREKAAQRLRDAIRQAVADGMHKSEAARRTGISRPTIDKWLR